MSDRHRHTRLCRSKECASSLGQGKTHPHKAAAPVLAMRVLHGSVRKCSGSKATLSVQDKMCTDIPSNSKFLIRRSQILVKLLSVFFFLFCYFATTNNYAYFWGFSVIYRLTYTTVLESNQDIVLSEISQAPSPPPTKG